MSASPSTKVDNNNYSIHHVYFLNSPLLTLWYTSLDPDPPYTVFTRLAGCHLAFVLSCFMMPLPIPSSFPNSSAVYPPDPLPQKGKRVCSEASNKC